MHTFGCVSARCESARPLDSLAKIRGGSWKGILGVLLATWDDILHPGLYTYQAVPL